MSKIFSPDETQEDKLRTDAYIEHDCKKSPDGSCDCDDREALDKFIDEEENKTSMERSKAQWNIMTDVNNQIWKAFGF